MKVSSLRVPDPLAWEFRKFHKPKTHGRPARSAITSDAPTDHEATAPVIPDVLASRYASRALLRIWSPEGKVLLERETWLAVMRTQQALGLDIPQRAINAYEKVKSLVDLASINQRERVLRHDVKARIEEFCALAGEEHIHKGLTSRDLTDNVEQLQMRRSLEELTSKCAAVLLRLSERAGQHKNLPMVARTHHVPAQPTTLGKRLAMAGEELLHGFGRLEALLRDYPLRGIKGAVGTQLDQISLFGGSVEKAEALEAGIARELGFARVLRNVGQVYPRSLDFEVVSVLFQVGAALANFARLIRLMTGHELLSEGFQKGQVGSSAMPHKMNARNAERINGFQTLLAGYLEMTSRLADGQWNEGDVSCSVVRRVALPSAMFACDGALETTLTILAEMQVFESVIQAELTRVMPFLATTSLLMAGVASGGGREQLHEVIRKHSLDVAAALKQGGLAENDLPRRLGEDPDYPLSTDEIETLLSNWPAFTGAANRQVEAFVESVQPLAQRFPKARSYQPEPVI